MSAVETAYGDEEVQIAIVSEDCAPEWHRTANMLWFERAGLDRDLAEALYAMDFDPDTHPAYPDARDVLAQVVSTGDQPPAP